MGFFDKIEKFHKTKKIRSLRIGELQYAQGATKRFCVNTELTVRHVIDRLIDLGLVKISYRMGDQ